jgi:hypothetical protein
MDYTVLLALKGNQGTLEKDVDLYFHGELFGNKLKNEQLELKSCRNNGERPWSY